VASCSSPYIKLLFLQIEILLASIFSCSRRGDISRAGFRWPNLASARDRAVDPAASFSYAVSTFVPVITGNRHQRTRVPLRRDRDEPKGRVLDSIGRLASFAFLM
jgi:hypothetical protein